MSEMKPLYTGFPSICISKSIMQQEKEKRGKEEKEREVKRHRIAREAAGKCMRMKEKKIYITPDGWKPIDGWTAARFGEMPPVDACTWYCVRHVSSPWPPLNS